AVPDMDAFGPARAVSEQRSRGGDVGIPSRGVMLDRPDNIEPQLIRQDALLDDIVVERPFAGPGDVRRRAFVDQGELHLRRHCMSVSVLIQSAQWSPRPQSRFISSVTAARLYGTSPDDARYSAGV